MPPEMVAARLLKKGEEFGLEDPRRLEEELAAYDALIQRFADSESPEVQRLVSVAMLNKAEALDHQATSSPYAEQLEIYNDLIRRFGGSTAPVLQESIALSMLKKADVLGWQEQPDVLEEIATYEALIQRFAASSERAIKECVAQSMYKKGRALRSLESSHLIEAITSLDELIQRFWAAVEPSVREFVLDALSLKACWLSCDEHPNEAIEAYDEVIRYAQLNSDLEFSPWHEAEALRRKGNAFLELEPPRMKEAIALYDEIIERFGNTEDVSLLLEIGRAMLNKGALYSRFDQPEAACALYDQIIARFGSNADESPFLRKRASEAMLQKGIVLYKKLGRIQEAISIYDELIKHFDGRWNMRNVFCALFNKGCVLIELERLDEAEAAYNNLIERFDGVRNRHKGFRDDELQEIYEKAHDMKLQISSLKENL